MRRWLAWGALGLGVVLACSEDPEPDGGDGNGAGQTSDDGGSNGTDSSGGAEASAGSGTDMGARGGATPGGAGPSTDGGSDSTMGGAGVGGDGGPPLPMAGPVSGLVRFGREPVPGVAVALGDQSTLTNSAGEFAFAFAELSYDLVLLSNEHKVAVVVDGLTTREPDIEFGVSVQSRTGTSIAGKLEGDVTPEGGGWTRVGFISNTAGNAVFKDLAPELSTFSLNAGWWWGSAHTGKLFALTFDFGNPDIFMGYAESEITITEDVPFGALDGSIAATHLTLAPTVGSRELVGTLDVADSLVGEARIMLGPADQPIGNQSLVDYQATVPVGIGLTSSIYYAAYSTELTNCSTIVSREIPDEGDLDLTVEAPAGPVLPVEDATGVTHTTNFTWSAPPANTVSYVVFRVGGWSITRYATTTHTTLPDLSAYGIALPANGAGTWRVFAIGPASSIDEAVPLENPQTLPGLLHDFVFSTSSTRSFTVAP